MQRALVQRMRELPDGALLELLATWLNAVGVHSLRAVRADTGDFNLAGTLRRGPEETPLAISIHRGQEPLDKESINALRGGLHRFDHARIGWIITLGKTKEGTSDEAHAEGAAPCAIFDGDALATSMEEVGVGIQRASIPIAVLDVGLLDSLGGGGASRTGTTSAPSSGGGSTDDGNNEPSSGKRRRGRRRGRRRSSRDESSEERRDAQAKEAQSEDSEPAEAKGSESDDVSESSPEVSEDTEKQAV